MEIKNILSIKITDGSFIAEARRLTSFAAESIGFNETDIGKISIIVTELVSNLIKHTSTHCGEFFVRELIIREQKGIELLSVDKGPGITNIADCLRDGYSTAGSVGTGLGSVQRLSDIFDIYSQKNSGTVILSRLWVDKNQSLSNETYDISGFSIPKSGEEFNGDGWISSQTSNKLLLMVCDGLGHGDQAAIAAEEAKKEFLLSYPYPLDEIMENLNSRLKHTRGAAVSLVEVNSINNIVRYCGIGNITGMIFSPESSRSLISHNGTVGHEIRKIQVFEYPWKDDSLLILFSDGLTSRWNFDKYPGLFSKTLPVILSTIHRDNTRGTDDTTIIAARNRLRES